ncbi:FG-GAP repeat domain-containing protein [Streptomyces melanogenes]|uniref:VCBS repeat-containing protein n=1 Tax=Streptomyces melanogenes TaxID=67326 RepID=A0ABZ1XR89_9ACTN|nr:VCBS repeat-containing protein [Streptomyces melanogenes]
MAKTSGRTRGRIASRLAAAAVTAALVATGASAVAADNPGKSATDAKPKAKTGVTAPRSNSLAAVSYFALYGVERDGFVYGYAPDGNGGLESRQYSGYGWDRTRDIAQTDLNNDGHADGFWARQNNGDLLYQPFGGQNFKVGGGWNTYNRVWAVGDLGGAGAGDLIARDGNGYLYLYLGYGNGNMTSRYKVGGGWGQYTQIAGNGDLTGDGKADIVARDGSGTLYLYKGTGNYKAPFEGRTRIGGGWNAYNTLVSVGDITGDGRTDLIARDGSGALWRYSGNGDARDPFESKVKIGNGGWNTYRLLF